MSVSLKSLLYAGSCFILFLCAVSGKVPVPDWMTTRLVRPAPPVGFDQRPVFIGAHRLEVWSVGHVYSNFSISPLAEPIPRPYGVPFQWCKEGVGFDQFGLEGEPTALVQVDYYRDAEDEKARIRSLRRHWSVPGFEPLLSPDGRLMVARSVHGFTVYDLLTGGVLHSIDGQAPSWDPSGNRLAYSSVDGEGVSGDRFTSHAHIITFHKGFRSNDAGAYFYGWSLDEGQQDMYP